MTAPFFTTTVPQPEPTAGRPGDDISSIMSSISNELSHLELLLPQRVPADLPEIRKILSHVFSSGGKRVRPALFYLSARLAGYNGPFLHETAVVWEYMHTASLLHDDVVDNSTLRRNKPTVNSVWGCETAVLVGDLIYATAGEILARIDISALGRLSASVTTAMSTGELIQLNHLFDADIPEDAYYRIVHGKTAALLSAACGSAAILKDCSPAERQALETFGRETGFAFQIMDDALDFTTTTAVMGKKTGADLARGTVTLPVILLRGRATADELDTVRRALRDVEPSADSIQRIIAMIDRYKTAESAIAKAAEHTNAAITALSVFPDSPAKSQLIALANALTRRRS